MKTATILPTNYLSLIQEDDYHMCLAHLIGKDKKYTDFYRTMSNTPGKYVIMDNGLIEGDPRPIEELVSKAYEIRAHELILPDVFRDTEATLEAACEAMDYLSSFKDLPFRLMAVPQGNTLNDWLYCAEQMIEWDIDCLGIPKVLVKIAGRDGRLEALKALGNKVRGLDIHLLGCWESPIEITMIEKAVQQKLIRPVRGVDSAIPYVYAREGLLLNQSERPAGHIDFTDKGTDIEVLKKNIEMWRDSCVIQESDKVVKLFY